MKVRSYLTIIVFACLVGGYVIQYMLGSQRDEVKQATKDFHVNEISVKDFSYLKQNVSQLLVSADLIFASNVTYLIAGAVEQSSLLLEQTDGLLTSDSIFKDHSQLVSIKERILEIQALLIQTSQQNFSEQLNQTNPFLDKFDQSSAQLVSDIEDVANVTKSQFEEKLIKLNRLNDVSRAIDIISTLSFLMLILVLWYWANKQISKPLAILSDRVKQTKNTYVFDGVDKGPVEVLKLSDQFHKLTNLLVFQANHDALTSLVNRREFERQLNYTLENFNKDLTYVVCYIDLDRFKIVNDTGGHAAGDQLLTQVGNLLSEKIRATDLVARMGGDEFTMLLKNCELDAAVELCNRLLQSIEDIRFEWEDEIFTISASIGLSVLTGEEANSHEPINIADEACSVAKQSGRNQVIVLDSSDKRIGQKRDETRYANKIMNAIDESKFKLYFQRIVSMKVNDARDMHCELLVRMEIEGGEIISPAVFFPIIERYNLHTELDQWVVREAINFHSDESIDTSDVKLCSINLSGPSICSRSFRSYLIDLIENASFPSYKLCFEITETTAIVDIDVAINFINELKRYGVRFALDDFGTGHSSFEYLKKLPVDFIKIDGSFVKDMLDNPADMATVKSIAEVAKATGKTIIAEYVHSKEIADALLDMDIEFAQGFYFHEPEALIVSENQHENNVVNIN